MSEYLWERTGEPDPEIVRLETALQPLRRIPPPPDLDAAAPRRGFDWHALAAAAAVVLALSALPTRTGPRRTPEAWPVQWLVATPGTHARAAREGRLAAGGWIDTRQDRARIEVGGIGQVILEPSTRVGLVDAGRRAHRLSLTEGTLHAMIWAPPGQFVVETKAARAVDLGCEYTLTVAADGSGLLRVETGWVGFEHHGLESLVPAGAVCRTYGGRGPGTPHFETATVTFAEALDVLDSGSGGALAADAMSRVLAEARPRDALSLWHLLSRLDRPGRARVYDRLAVLVPPPDGVTREGIAGGDAGMRDRWWDELGLGSAAFWREWTRRWSDVQAGTSGEDRRANGER